MTTPDKTPADSAPDKTPAESSSSLFLKWMAVVAALGVLAVGIWLLWGVWRGRPAAAAFTRVGGATRVDTAVDASRFWLTPPKLVVIAPANASQATMFWAARCAMANDAPLLFSRGNPKKPGLVDRTIDRWRKEGGAARTVVIRKPGDVPGCPAIGQRVNVRGLSGFKAPNQPLQPPYVKPQNTLAPVVVFAAPRAPGDPPDVAVGMALAAHMARTATQMATRGPTAHNALIGWDISFAVPRYLKPTAPAHRYLMSTAKATTGPEVSLVVVPRYLEADPSLEDRLQQQHELVRGGVVLGSTKILADDTRALLRQFLTATDRQGVLAQVQANLGSVGSLIGALLALVGLATVVRVAGPIVIVRLERAERDRPAQKAAEKKAAEKKAAARKAAAKEAAARKAAEKKAAKLKNSPRGIWMSTMAKFLGLGKSDWLIALRGERKVTIQLRSGREVVGTIDGQFHANARDTTVFRIREAPPPASKEAPPPPSNDKDSQEKASPPGPDGTYVLVSVKEIEQIHFLVRNQEAANPQPTAGVTRADPS